MNGQDRHKGYTLIELLIVMAIIAMLSAVTIPVMMRSGIFGGNPTDAAARDIFALLRASQVYATTQNVDAAIAYGVAIDGVIGNVPRRPQDNLFTGTFGVDSFPNTDILPSELIEDLYIDNTFPEDFIPGDFRTDAAVLGSSMLIRRITIQELNQIAGNPDGAPGDKQSLAAAIIKEFDATEHNNIVLGIGVNSYDDTKELFVPVGNRFGKFQEFPSDTCLITNEPKFWLSDDNLVLTATASGIDPPPNVNLNEELGLQGVYIIQYDLVFDSNINDNIFEIHRILPSNQNVIPELDVTPDQGFTSQLNTAWKNKFPAHVFKKSGGLDAPTNTLKQRIRLSVGLLPNANYYDRFIVNEDTDLLLTLNEYNGEPALDLDPNTFKGLVPRETNILLYVATGRVKVAAAHE